MLSGVYTRIKDLKDFQTVDDHTLVANDGEKLTVETAFHHDVHRWRAITYVGGSKTVGVGKHPLHVPAADFQILPAVLPLLLTLQPPSCPCRILRHIRYGPPVKRIRYAPMKCMT